MNSSGKRDEWNNYCVYSGKYLPDAAMNNEHVIPKSLGGNSSTVIRASKELNSRFATLIDGPITRDPMVMFGRRDTNARGHSKKDPIARLTGNHIWKPGEPIPTTSGQYNVDVPRGGRPTIYDTKSGQKQVGMPEGVLINPKMMIDHISRLKFTTKTLLGVGWKLFQAELLSALDVDMLRNILTANIGLQEGGGQGGLRYADPFLVKNEDRETHELTKIEKVLVSEKETSILMREFDERLEWSLSCVGYMVGSVSLPIQGQLLEGDVQPRGGIKLTVTRDRLTPDLIAPF